ncbi:MAG TPA: ribosome biogenesis GTPase Der [Terriglobales bacterium]|nr:ribosome biogenesis GTPase Der [Terriglobales bacterium]
MKKIKYNTNREVPHGASVGVGLASTPQAQDPLLAIVGRPNVGKSTLFNRLVGSPRAIVGDEPGITRDRLYGNTEWRGRAFRVVDTGGIIPEDKDFIPAEIFRQARVALDEAAAIVMVVDGRTELAAPDLELVRLLIKTGKPLFLAVNKIDSDKQESLTGDFHRLGVKEVFPLSAEHGHGVDDLLDAFLAILPSQDKAAPVASDRGGSKRSKKRRFEEDEDELEGADLPTTDSPTANDPGPTTEEPEVDHRATEVKVAIIGHPNVGKSTLLNQLTGTSRAIVSPIPGTTRDAIDEIVERDGQVFRFIDTAGIRRKGKTHLMAEKLSVVMSRKHLEDADIALLVIDATEGVSALDATIAGYAHESGRSIIILVNKWDLVTTGKKRAISQARAARIQDTNRPQDQKLYIDRLRNSLKFLNYAPVLFISASTGKNVDKIFPLLEEVARERRKRVGTGEMNRFLKHVDFERASVPMSQRVKILYLTQANIAPPTFILFTDRAVKLHFSYQRFLENQIRHAFGFVGTPIWIKTRARD